MIAESMNKSYTIDEALAVAEKQDEEIEESFNITWEDYNVTSKYRKDYLRALKITRIKTKLLKLVSAFLNNGSVELVDLTSKRVDLSIEELNNIKKLLDELDLAIKRLHFSKMAVCNYDICSLLACLVNKIQLDSKSLIDEINQYSLSMRGIGYINNNDDEQSMDELNKQIDSTVAKLGLNQNKQA